MDYAIAVILFMGLLWWVAKSVL